MVILRFFLLIKLKKLNFICIFLILVEWFIFIGLIMYFMLLGSWFGLGERGGEGKRDFFFF